MARAILKQGTKILKTGNKILTVGDTREPAADYNPALLINIDTILPFNNGDSVTRWNDVINGNHAIQTTQANKGTYIVNALGTHPAINVNGSQYYSLLSTIKVGTIFLVVKANVINQQYGSVLGGPQQMGTQFGFIGGQANTWFSGDSGSVGNSFGVNKQNRLFINGGKVSDPALGNRTSIFILLSLDITDSRFISVIGASNLTFDYRFNGQFLRIIPYDYRMTEASRKQKELELMNFYNL